MQVPGCHSVRACQNGCIGTISAQERRESAIRAAIDELALKGYCDTSTEAIARRVGVTQPYLFRLFPGKKAIFAAALTRSMEDAFLAFERAADGAEGGEEALHAMASAYTRLLSAHPETLLMQMQGYALAAAAAAAAEAQGDDRIGELVRVGWMRLWETVRLSLGGGEGEAAAFLTRGMLINTPTAIGLPSDCREVGL